MGVCHTGHGYSRTTAISNTLVRNRGCGRRCGFHGGCVLLVRGIRGRLLLLSWRRSVLLVAIVTGGSRCWLSGGGLGVRCWRSSYLWGVVAPLYLADSWREGGREKEHRSHIVLSFVRFIRCQRLTMLVLRGGRGGRFGWSVGGSLVGGGLWRPCSGSAVTRHLHAVAHRALLVAVSIAIAVLLGHSLGVGISN